jgi:uncharacterized membrane protein YhaH (DUF805 family)
MTQYAVSFGEAIKRYWTDNWTVKGRASRSEFWKGALGNALLLSVAVYFIALALAMAEMLLLLTALQFLLGLATSWIGMILTMRRLHDIGKSGWWIWISLIPLIGSILLLIWGCRASDPTENQYGPVPNVK